MKAYAPPMMDIASNQAATGERFTLSQRFQGASDG